MPYWTTATEGGGTAAAAGGDGGSNSSSTSSGFSHPDPLSVSDLPAPLVPFEDFLCGDGDGGSVGSGGGGGGERQAGRGRGRVAGGEEAAEIEFEPTAFDHPVFIMFSSGTTGLPKCMVHGAGGEIFACTKCMYKVLGAKLQFQGKDECILQCRCCCHTGSGNRSDYCCMLELREGGNTALAAGALRRF